MSAPLGTAVRDAAREQLRRELAVRLTAAHGAVLRRVPDLYRRIIGEALLAEDGQTGKGAQLRAAQRALDRIARIGVVDFTDSTGRRWNMQSYVEMSVRTGALRAMTTAQMRVYRERGLTLVRVSDHAGGCLLCAPFEGRLLAIDAMPTEPVTDRSGRRVEVVATVAEAIAAGLVHPSCRHTMAPFVPGVTVLPPPQPHDPTEYADQQRLRALERAVRFWRRREAAAITPEARDLAARKVREWQGAIRAHVAATGTRRLRGREQVERALTSPTPRRRQNLQTAGPRATLDAWTDDVTRIAAITQPETRDDRLAAIWRAQGFDALPALVPPGGLDTLPASYRRVYRGIAGTDAPLWADQFRRGQDPFAGLGAYGNGTYTTTDEQSARGYSTGRGWRGANADGVILRMALRPDARVVTLADLRVIAATDPRLQTRPYGPAFGDPGRLAAALGYDAIEYAPDPNEAERYLVVLNRGALIVEEPR